MNAIPGYSLARTSIVALRLVIAGLVLDASAQEVIPDFYREPGLYPTRSYVNQNFNEHIDPFTGALQHHYVDVFLPGNGGFDLKVVRSYNSASIDPINPSAYESQAGLGWTIHFGRVLKTRETTICSNLNSLSVADNPVLELPDGSRQLLAFTGQSSPLMLTTQRWRADCILSGSGGLAVYSPDGTRYDMTQRVNVGTALNPVYAWYTTQITDRNGNTATISYAVASPEITNVSTSDGRSISFAYFDSGLLSRRIASITASGGQTFTYGYEAVPNVSSKYFLKTVTRPGGTTWQYFYNGALGGSSLPGGVTPLPGPTPLLTGGGAEPLADQPGSYVMYRVKYPEGGTIDYSYGWAYFDAQARTYGSVLSQLTQV